jgi:hypothetical protein
MKQAIRLFGFFVFLCSLAGPQLAQAAPVVYFGEDLGGGEETPLASWPNSDAAHDAFIANLVGVGTEDFEGIDPGTGAPLPVVFPGAGTATLLGNGEVFEVLGGGTNGFGRYPISGTRYWESSDAFRIEFDAPIAAFGFYATDVGDFQGQLTLTLTDGQTVDLVVPNTIGGLGGAVIFYGFYDAQDQYTAVTFGNTAPGVDFFGFDDMTLGSLQQLTGACCLAGYECTTVSQPECDRMGGMFLGGSCDPNPCLPQAVCCMEHECLVTTREECLALGGMYYPQWESCEPNPCEMYSPVEEASWGRIKAIYR